MPERMLIDQVKGIAVHPWLEERLTRIISFTAVPAPVIADIIACGCISDRQHFCACQWRGRPRGDEPARRAEFLNAAPVVITHIDMIGIVDSNAHGPVEFTIPGTRRTPLRDKVSSAVEFLNPIVEMVYHIQIVIDIDGDAHG